MASRHKVLRYKDMTEMGYGLVDTSLECEGWMGHTSLVYTWPPMTLYSRTSKYNFDLGSMFLTKRRWGLMLRTYLNQENLKLFKSRLRKIITDRKQIHSATLDFTNLSSKNHKGKNHPLGSCLLGLTYVHYPPMVILHSRTTRIGYTSFVDLMLAHKIIEQIICPMVKDSSALHKNISPAKIPFRWHIDLPQLSALYVLYYVATSPQWKKRLVRKRHTHHIWIQMARNYQYLLTGKAKFGPAKNLCKKIKRGIFKSVPIEELNIEK